ncbi:MAG: 50S ribosomal protein L1 [Candidatus Omnitrophica bacterium]|nr:50S ribosomal protein L1 [Candidatus Omnitrophota bacterium]
MKQGKRFEAATKLVDPNKVYSLEEALAVLLETPQPKFDQTLEIACKLNVDASKSDQIVRGAVVLPHGTGKKIRILVFCEPEKEKDAKDAGADFVGGQDIADKITKENWLDFDYCIATPKSMPVVSRLGRVLGPRGLMPSTKTGTVTDNVAFAVNEAKKGKIDFRMDKAGCIHVGVGKVSFSAKALKENVIAFLDALKAARPSSVKGDFMGNVYLSLTMSPSVKVQV